MIIDLLKRIHQEYLIILASGSPRRKQILEQLGLQFIVLPSEFEENLPKHVGPSNYVKNTSFGKANEVLKQLKGFYSMHQNHEEKESDKQPEHTLSKERLQVWKKLLPEKLNKKVLLISADSVVVNAGTLSLSEQELSTKIMEKPRSKAQAKKMIRELSSSKIHYVITGVTLIVLNDRLSQQAEKEFSDKTYVEFDTIPDSVIEEYIKLPEPYDKAGGYAIQGMGSQFIKTIRGSYTNVVGFPSYLFCAHLREIVTKLH